MEKKTIGQFIAALRKANGMTQKQLAEKLNVSDKAVSRWERDESAPDLMLIPVIAEIFGVTSDELLRGEKKNVESAVTSRETERTEKRIEYMLKNIKFKLDIRGIISLGIAIAGLVIAMVCNYGFYRSYLAFYMGSIFCLIGLICEIIFAKQAFYSMDYSEYKTPEFGVCKKKMVFNIEKIIISIIAIFVFCIPLIIFGRAYKCVDAPDWFFAGAAFSLIVCILGWIISLKINVKQIESYGLPEKETKQELAVNRKRISYILTAIGLICVTGIAQLNFNDCVSAIDFVGGKTFYDLEEFVKYMETPYYEEFIDGELIAITDAFVEMEEVDSGDIFEEDENINDTLEEEGEEEEDIYEDEYEDEYEYGYGESICKDNGDVIATYVCRNEAVYEIRFEWDDNDEFESVTTYTRSDFRTGNIRLDIANWLWVIIYIAELTIIIIKYKKKIKEIYGE